MADTYEQKTHVIQVPKNIGVEGFIKAIREALRLPRVQRIVIDELGKVTTSYFEKTGVLSRSPIAEDFFDDVSPYNIVRNTKVVEIPYGDENCAIAAGQLFHKASLDGLLPTAFIVSPNTWLWDWYKETTRLPVDAGGTLYGLPVESDRFVGDETLILCAGYRRDGALTDTVCCYKMLIPRTPK